METCRRLTKHPVPYVRETCKTKTLEEHDVPAHQVHSRSRDEVLGVRNLLGQYLVSREPLWLVIEPRRVGGSYGA